MALATVADLKKYMDITFSNTQEEAALMILTGLEADLEHYIGRPVTAAVSYTHLTLPTICSV